MSREIEPMEKKVTKFGRFLFVTRAARFYHNGDGAGFVWRWCHPLAWVMAPTALIALSLLEGFPNAWEGRHQVGFGIDPWFLENPDKLVWAKP